MCATESYKILLIDDDPDSFYISERLLSQVGAAAVYEVQWVDNCESGLEMLRKRDHQACLLDYNLGADNGLDLLRLAIGEGCTIPIILLTGHEDREVDLLAMKSGAADFLSKNGLTAALLERVLRYAIDRRNSHKLRLRDEAYRHLITEQLPAILWTTDPQLRFTSLMGTGLSKLNLQPGVLIGKTVFDYLQTTNSDNAVIVAHRRALDGESVSVELVWMDRIFQFRIEPLHHGSHRVEGTIAVCLDVTDHRRVEVGFQAAREIQQRLLPRAAPQLRGYDIGGMCRPTEATGGDLYDYVPMSDGSLGIVVADVSGHGFGPALIMAETRRVLRTLTDLRSDLPMIMSVTNRAIFEDTDPGLFVTAFFAKVDPTTRTLNYFGAGHEGYLFDLTGEMTKLESNSFPLGLIDEFEHDVRIPIQLQPGNVLVLLTDGFAEAMALDGSLFGIDRALDVIRAHLDQPAAEILNILYQSVRDFCHPKQHHDDITGVILKVNALD